MKEKKGKLLVSGCSYTYGADKEIDGTIPWPDQLAEKLEMECINICLLYTSPSPRD